MGSIFGGGDRAARRAADAQVTANRESIASLERINAENNALQQPFRDFGMQAFQPLNALMGFGGDQASALAALRNRPGYQFRFNQGQDAIQESAALRGMLHSGATLRALNDHGQNYADAGYNDEINRLLAIMGGGQQVTSQITNMNSDTARQVAASQRAIGDARGQGYLNAAAARERGIDQGLGALGRFFGGF